VPALEKMFPALKLAGYEPSKFRTARPGEATEIADRIRTSGARVVLVGLGCPRQEIFAYAMRPLLDMPQLAVGAAFDYHAGLLRKPPPWMQRAGLEWLWRLGLEPRRLWRRYVILNPAYLSRLFAQKTGAWKAAPPPPATEPLSEFPV
jgi:N-acetylglucosaminyldiphosphoundecaprenol N-acetyl-beta-D-mannosaminyltransferase